MIPRQIPRRRRRQEARARHCRGYLGRVRYAMRPAAMPPTGTPRLRGRSAAPICRFTSMVNLNNRQELPDAPVMHIVDGKAVEPRDYNWLERIVRFLLRPFVEAWHHRDLIAAILRRELRERFSGSMAGWVWAVVAPLISLVTYTLVFGGVGEATQQNPVQFLDRLRAFHLRRAGGVQLLHRDGVPGALAAPRIRPLHQADDVSGRDAADHLDAAGDDICLDRPGSDAGLPASLHRDAALDRAAAAAVVHPVPDVPDRHHLAVVRAWGHSRATPPTS